MYASYCVKRLMYSSWSCGRYSVKVLKAVKSIVKLAVGAAARVLWGLHASAAGSGVTVFMNHRIKGGIKL